MLSGLAALSVHSWRPAAPAPVGSRAHLVLRNVDAESTQVIIL